MSNLNNYAEISVTDAEIDAFIAEVEATTPYVSECKIFDTETNRYVSLNDFINTYY